MRLVLAALALSLAAPVVAADTSAGRALYMDHCAACHGAGGTGDGPMASLVTVEVPDLTEIATRSGGTFPMARVVQTIDGRIALRGHGGPMLVYGQILGGGSAVVDGPDGSPIETRGDIVSIAEYLQSIQTD